MTFSLDLALERSRAERERSREALMELLRIPSVSADPAHDGDCRRAAEWVAARLRGAGMAVEVTDVPGPGRRHPVVAAEWLGAGPDRPTLGLYGHYDVQPPDPLEEWETAPFEPAVRGGEVFARGADDNKGQLMCGVRAIELAMAAGGAPVNLRFLLEGEEEVSGPSLPEFLRREAARLETDYLLIADGQFLAPGQPNLVTGLRGLLYTEVEVAGAAADLHSGIFGGVAPNPFNTLAHVLAALKDREGRVQVPGFYDGVVEPAPEELLAWQALPGTEEELRDSIGARALEGEPGYSAVQRRWARPTLDVHGVLGGFQGEGQKTVIPARAVAKVSMRLVPGQDPDAVFEAFSRFVEAQSTPGCRVTARNLAGTPAVRAGIDHAGVAAARRAFLAAYGREPVFTREGGSIPVTVDFQEALGCALIVTGFGLPGDRLHSPNERMALDQYDRGIEMVLHLMAQLDAG